MNNTINDDLNATINNIYSQQRAYFESLEDRSTTQDKSLKLPRINIPPFSGEYTQWPAFKDLYEATIHKNESISRVHKFQLLKGLLQGSAAKVITHVLITDDNYDEVWNKLQKRYDNKRSIVSTIIQTFLDQPKIQHTSFSQLRTLAETSDELLRGLKAAGPDCESRDPWLLHLLANKLDDATKQQWALHSATLEPPNVNDFFNFLHRRCDALQSFNVNVKSSKHLPRVSYAATTKPECLCCHKSHPLHKCYKFQGFGREYRRNFVDNHNLCINCLNEGHSPDNCPLQNTCFRCKSKHHTLLHVFNNTDETRQLNSNTVSTSNHSDSTETIESGNSPKNVLSTTKVVVSDSRQTVLPTVVITTTDIHGKIHNIRALLDSGSECTFITADLTKKLGLKRSHACFSVNGLSAISAGQTKGKINIKLSSRYHPENFVVVDTLILNNLTTYLPPRAILLNTYDTEKFDEYRLADPEFHNPKPIEMILGIDIFYDIVKEKRILFKPNLHLIDSIFGWVVAGIVDKQCNIELHCHTVRISSEDIHQLLQRFWEVQENSFESPTKDDACEEHFLKTHKFVNGRYEVELPFKDNCEYAGSTLKQARSRMMSMERKFYKDPELKTEYVKFMREYEALGHMECISDREILGEVKLIHYLPHHAVIKPSSTTSKLRVVFDGSCKSNTGLSLNDILRTGPTIQDDLFSILSRFRKHKIAFVSDIEKMYRQIRINPKHHDYQRIVWRENPLRPMQHLQLKTVTYGLTCSAFLAIRSLHQTAIDNKEITPMLLNIIKSDFYVDDLLTGCDSINEAVVIYNDISKILSNSGFSLRQWSSNDQEFLSNIPIESRGKDAISIEDAESYNKTLGICWLTKEDNFAFNVPDLNSHQITKRGLLSECGKLFDPLGWLSPVTITFKILLQSLWLTKLEWDDPLPEEVIVGF